MRDRSISFDSIFNFRDLGGHRAADRQTIRWRRPFRADVLWRLRGDDLIRFQAHAIRTVVDLRMAEQADRDGRIRPAGYVWRHVNVKLTE